MTGSTAAAVRVAWERRGEGFPLVLVHGLGYARWGWEPVADRLAERYEVVLLDNRGIGDSDAPAGPYSVADMAGDVLRVLDQADIDRAHIVGTSLGGMIAQEVALTAPERVESLVLDATTPGGTHAAPMPEVTVRLIAEAATLEPQIALRRFVENAVGERASNGVVERIVAHRLRIAQSLEAWSAQAAAGVAFDAWGRLPSLEAQTLVLHGTADVVVDPANAQLLATRIPNSTVELFPGCGHLICWEEPDRYVEVITGFLR